MTRTEENTSLEEKNNDGDTDLLSPAKKKSPATMLVFREIFFIFAVSITTYATILNSQQKYSRGAPATPFFNHPDIRDFYQGDLAQLMHDVTYVDFAFVMFYAPWDADSQDVREEFVEVSEFYSEKVYFAGVNCWEPGSECRTTFKDIVYHFPQLVAYLGPQKAIEYKGPFTSDHMIRFLHSIMHPYERIDTVPELWNLRYLHDAVLVGHFQFKGFFGSVNFKVLYETALRLASRDHLRQVAIAVFTHSRLNPLLGIGEQPAIVLYLWDKRIVYHGHLSPEALVTWVFQNTYKGLAELNSNTLLPHVKGGAAMVMFTPRHPLATISPYYQLLRRIAMNFNFCSNRTTGILDDDFFSYVLNYGSALQAEYEEAILNGDRALREECAAMKKRQLAQATPPCTTISALKWDNMTCYNSQSYCTSPNFRLRFSDDLNFKTLNRQSKNNELSSEQLIQQAKEDKCALINRSPPPLSPKPSTNLAPIPVTCETNSSFSFIVLDSSRYSHLANGFGIQLKKAKHRTSVVIFDNEEILKLNSAEVTEASVSELLKRYSSGERERPLRAMKDTKNYRYRRSHSSDSNIVSIIELDTHDFDRVALNESQNVLVLFHSPYCSFCLGVSNVFLTIAHFLKDISFLTLARIDGEMNDLPWQYTVHKYPSIIFFPAKRKLESRVFPDRLPLTINTIGSFLLSNLKEFQRVPVMLAFCSRWGADPTMSPEGDICLRSARSHCLDAISSTLRKYRMNLLRMKYYSNSSIQVQLSERLHHLMRILQFLKFAHYHLHFVQNIHQSVSILEKKLKQFALE